MSCMKLKVMWSTLVLSCFQIFHGQMTERTTCLSCQKQYDTDVPFWLLPLSLVNSGSDNSVVSFWEHFNIIFSLLLCIQTFLRYICWVRFLVIQINMHVLCQQQDVKQKDVSLLEPLSFYWLDFIHNFFFLCLASSNSVYWQWSCRKAETSFSGLTKQTLMLGVLL